MKRLTMILALVLMMAMPAIAQRNALHKIAPELREEMSRKDSHDDYSIIIVMSDQYDQLQLSKQIQYLGKSERRSFVIQELQVFSKANQHDLQLLFDEAAKNHAVKDVKSFWLFNGMSCTANREMIEILSQRNDIAFIDLDRIVKLPDYGEPVEINEHSESSIAWHVSQVRADEVWNYNGDSGYDGTGVIVALIDTGVNYNHLDLADHMWDGGPEYPHHGYDFYDNDNDPMDEYGHGSHCAGITAGDGTCGMQTGIAPNANIMALKVFGSEGEAATDVILQAMQFAVEHGADVVNMSLGSPGVGGVAPYRTAFINMMNANVVACVSAGNDGEKYLDNVYSVPVNVGSPGNNPSPWHNPDQTLSGGQSAVITIGASNRNDRKATFSSFGPVTWSDVSDYSDYPYTAGSTTDIGLIKPDIIVPGTAIISCKFPTETNDDYVVHMGTSMATPLASGIMALMLQAKPDLTPSEIDSILEVTALPADFRVTKNNYTGAGRADALNCIDAIFTAASQPTNLNLETCGGNVTLTWTPSATAPNGYCIYRDNVQVGTTTETFYTDVNVGTGKHVYYVRANDDNDRQSVRSNAVLCLIEPYASIPDNLTVSWDGINATLNWDASITSCNDVTSTDLSYNLNPTNGYPSNSTLFWGIKYEPEDLRDYIGMSIDQISVVIYSTNLTHTLRIYRGTSYGNTTGEPVYTQSFTPTCGQLEIQTVTLDTPYIIDDIYEDLWITCSATPETDTDLAVAAIGIYDGHAANCFYRNMSNDPNNVVWRHFPDGGGDYAACLSAHLTRTTTYSPTYNLYLDNNSVASNLSNPTYTGTPIIHSGNNNYHVTSTIGNNESCPSSNASIVVDDNDLFAYVINGEIVINQEGTLQIVDMTGRIIVSHSGRIQCVPTTGMALGVYVLRLINGDNVKTQKIVIE